MTHFGKILKALRTHTGRSQYDVAKPAGTSASLLSKMERGGVKQPNIDTIRALMNELGYPEPVTCDDRGLRHAIIERAVQGAYARYEARHGKPAVRRVTTNENNNEGSE